jgi:rfaE bifunctional protein kinase chain/domain
MTDKKILVTGDFILDLFYLGNVQRVSPEAPNLILDVEKMSKVRGGAYNVVEHCRSLGLSSTFHSVCGKMQGSMTTPVMQFEAEDKIIWVPDRPLTTKSRYISSYKYHTLLRVDEEVRNDISIDQADQLLQHIKDAADELSVICVVDYNKGVVTERLMKGIEEVSNQKNIKIIVDTKRSSFEIFRNVSIIKPNQKEFELSKEIYGFKESSSEDFTMFIYKTFGIENVIVTKGNKGADLYSKGKLTAAFEGHNRVPMELSGAGDSVCACIAYAMSKNMELKYGVKIANKAASVYVTQPASYRIRLEDFEG